MAKARKASKKKKPAPKRAAAPKRQSKRAPKTPPPPKAIPPPVYAWGGGAISDPKRERLLAVERSRIERLQRQLAEGFAYYAAIASAPRAVAALPAVPKRKPKKKPPPLKPRKWFQETETDDQRASELVYLKGAVEDLRQYYRGFESKDGYNADRIPEWTPAQIKKVRTMVEPLRSRLARQHTRVVPNEKYRDADKRAAFKKQLRKVTGQTHPDQYAWVYPIQTTVRKVDVVLNERGNLEEHDHITGTYIKTERWYFRDFAKHPATEKQFTAAAKKMLKVIPHHLFLSFFTDRDVIGSPFEAALLLENLAGYFVKSYQQQGEWLLGVINQGSRARTLKSYNKRLEKRLKARKAKSKAGKIARRRRTHEIQQINRWRKEFGGKTIPLPKSPVIPKDIQNEKPPDKKGYTLSPAMQAIKDKSTGLVYDLSLNGKVISTHDRDADAMKARDRLISASSGMMTKDDFMIGVRFKK